MDDERTTPFSQASASAGYTMQQVADALGALAPSMQSAWQTALEDDALWRERAKRVGRVKTWWLRRTLQRI